MRPSFLVKINGMSWFGLPWSTSGIAAVFLAANFFSCACVPAKLTREELNTTLDETIQNAFIPDKKRDLEARRLLDQGASAQDALVQAAGFNRLNIVKMLLERGADINAPHGVFDWTPLHAAAANGAFPVAKYLLERGAKCCEQSLEGTPAETARKHNRPGLAALLDKASGNVAAPVRQESPVVRAQVQAKTIVAPNFNVQKDEDAYAVIIGIENYPDLPAATYAERDANAAKSFIRAMGVPERNIVLLTGNRATKTGMEKTIEAWLPNNVSEKSRVYFYYSGHGAPDTKTGDAYLVPSDGDPQYLAQTGYSLKRLYAKLGQLKAKSVIVALDSCFSGAGGRSVLARGTRPLVGKVDMAVQGEGKVSVISASAGDQISGSNEDAGYGLFTYNLLQGLNGAAKDTKGQVTLQSLYGYLKPRVQDDARRGNREQTPQLQSGGEDMILRAK